ncbi:MAG: hypothetical protein ACTSRH_12215 [Promethearchaeota archaeon]
MDDSTYPDAFELWANEIYYILYKPSVPTTPSKIPGFNIFSLLLSIMGFSVIIIYKLHRKEKY